MWQRPVRGSLAGKVTALSPGKEEASLLTFFLELCLRQTSRLCWTLGVHAAAVCCPVT